MGGVLKYIQPFFQTINQAIQIYTSTLNSSFVEADLIQDLSTWAHSLSTAPQASIGTESHKEKWPPMCRQWLWIEICGLKEGYVCQCAAILQNLVHIGK